MAKSVILFEQAEQLYVQQGFSIDTILKLLKNEVSRKTLYNWKADGNWDKKRAANIEATKNLRQDLMEVAEAMAKELKLNPNPQKIFGLLKLLQAIKITTDLPEESPEAEKTGGTKKLSAELVEQIEREILGI